MEHAMNDQELKRRVRRLFRCGVRLSVFPDGETFVVLRRRRSTLAVTARHGTEWRDETGAARHFNYFMEQVVASGRGCAAAWRSARQYRELGGRRPGDETPPKTREAAWRKLLQNSKSAKTPAKACENK